MYFYLPQIADLPCSLERVVLLVLFIVAQKKGGLIKNYVSSGFSFLRIASHHKKSLGGKSDARGSQRPRPITQPRQSSRRTLKLTYTYRSNVTLAIGDKETSAIIWHFSLNHSVLSQNALGQVHY
jgi:hypothetical protein